MELVMDVEGFKSSANTFIFKEVSISNVIGTTVDTYLFKPPFPWGGLQVRYKSENSWLTRNYHGLSWESGSVPYTAVSLTLQPFLQAASVIYVKGLEKRKWLQENFPKTDFINIEDIGCPSLSKLQTMQEDIERCPHHIKADCVARSCAEENVQLLKYWLSQRDSV